MSSTTPIAEMVRVMLERDVPRDVIVTVVGAAERHAESVTRHVTERDARTKAAARAKKYRENKKLGVTSRPRDDDKPPLTLTSSSPKQDQKKEGKKVSARKAPLSADWQPQPEHFAAADKLKIPRAAVLAKAEDMRIWAGANGALKLNWDLTFHGFLRRDASQLARGGNTNGKQHDGQSKSVLDAFDRLEQRLRAGGDDNAPGQDDLLSLPTR